MVWDSDEVVWIRVMDHLMTMTLGGDFLKYEYDKKKICHVIDDYKPAFVYSREDWLEEYACMVTSDAMEMGTKKGLFFIMAYMYTHLINITQRWLQAAGT